MGYELTQITQVRVIIFNHLAEQNQLKKLIKRN